MQTEAHYRLYFLDADGHVVRAKNLRCDGDDEAVKLALHHPRDHAMELWQGSQRLQSFALDDLISRRSEYVLYLLNQDQVVALTSIDAPNDISAWMIAGHIFHACDDECDAFEVWYGDRLIQVQGQDGDTPDAETFDNRLAALERRHQNLVIEREIQLQDSYAAIRRSRKLLDTVEVLKPLFGAF